MSSWVACGTWAAGLSLPVRPPITGPSVPPSCILPASSIQGVSTALALFTGQDKVTILTFPNMAG